MDIVKYPDPILYQVAQPVAEDEFGEKLAATARDMFETMYDNRGVGLAGNQVALLKRIFVVNVEPGKGTERELVFVNPEIIERSGEQIGEEGCLSIPGVGGKVTRANVVKVRARDAFGNPFELDAEGYLARAIQHELDHIDGKLFIDKISFTDKTLCEKNLKFLRSEYEAKQKRKKEKEKAKDAKKNKRPRIKKQ